MKIFFATDIHGSDICWSKFLNAAKFYEADKLILGGDMTGKAIVPFIHQGGKNYKVTLLEQEFQTTNDDELQEMVKRVRSRGYYPYMTNPDEEKYLCSEKGQWQIAEMISDGIVSNLGTHPVYPNIAMTESAIKGYNPAQKKDNYIYKIQLAAMKSYPPEQSRWRKNGDFEILKDGDLYRVVYGSFLSPAEAGKEKENLRKGGYKDAFVIKFLADKKID